MNETPKNSRQSSSPTSTHPVTVGTAPQQGHPEAIPAHLDPASDSFDPAAGLQRWAKQMDIYTGPDAMLDFNQVDYVHIDLSHANPSGLAQLLAGRKTRLSTILRDKSRLEEGMRAARTLRTKIYELATDHGLDAGYFVAGTASWLSRSAGEHATSYEKRFIAPILMAPLSITPHPTGNDFELRLAGAARLNPAMVRQIKQEYDIDLGTMDVAQLANSMSRLDPEPVIERMRASAGNIPGMTIESKFFISTFADLKESVGELPHTAHTPLVRDLAALKAPGIAPAISSLTQNQPSLDERDPTQEMLLLDADPAEQTIVDAAASGNSFTVTAAPGTEPLRTAVNIAGTLIGQGKSVLVVGEKRSTLAEFTDLLQRTGIDALRFDLLTDRNAESQRTEFIRAIMRNEQASEPHHQNLNNDLTETRTRLREHTNALLVHEPYWNISMYRALQVLAQLTATDDAPSTRVRFTRRMLDRLIERTDRAEELTRLAELGAFTEQSRVSPWYRARLVNDEETADAYALVLTIRSSLLSLREAMNKAAATAGMRTATTITEWQSQLRILVRIRETLTRFHPEVYDRPVTDLVAATATGAWRRENGIEMNSMQRSRLRRAAKEYVLPGINIGDLHEQLLVVQDERTEWMRHLARPSTPQIPAGLDELVAAVESLVKELDGLSIVLADSPAGTNFINTHLDALDTRLDALLEDQELLSSLPERDMLTARLISYGLDELMEDLYTRQVPAHLAAAELELAWWQSALEELIRDHQGKVLGGDALRAAEAKFRRTDYEHMAAAPSRLLWRAGQLWAERIEQYHEQAAYLKSQLRGHQFALDQLLEFAPTMATTLLPLWTASPFALARKVPAIMRFDAVILLDSESTPLAANLPAITRADQVIALGDPNSGYPAPFIVSALATGAPAAASQKLDSTFDALAHVVPGLSLAQLNRSPDPVIFDYLNREFYGGQLLLNPVSSASTYPQGTLRVEYIDTRGKVSDNANQDSPSFEVERVTRLVLEHAYYHPQRSLAVVTASPKHAQRVAGAVRQAIIKYPQLAPFFAPGREPFRVVDVTRAEGMERDTIIFSLGVGRPRPGRVVPYMLGQLSEERGREGFVIAMTRARRETLIVSCVNPQDLDPNQLEYGALDLYRVLLNHQSQLQRTRDEQHSASIPKAFPQNAFLARDDTPLPDTGDWLLNDLLERLRAQGVRFESGRGDTVFVAYAPEPEEAQATGAAGIYAPQLGQQNQQPQQERVAAMPLVARSDSEASYAASAVRERTRLIPERLSRTGWNYMTLNTVEVFADPDAVVSRILRYVGMSEDEPR